jgi:hypothetical protein
MVIFGMLTQQSRQQAKQRPLLIIGVVMVYGFTNLYAHANWGHHSSRTCLLSAQCVNFVRNEGNFVQMSAPYITLCDFLDKKVLLPTFGTIQTHFIVVGGIAH